MQKYNNLGDLLEKNSKAFKYYSTLSYDVQEMLNDANPSICSENELIDYIENHVVIGDN